MAKLLAALGILLVANIIGSSASKLPSNVTVEVLTSEELKDILKQYPNATELPRTIRDQTVSEETRKGAVQLEYSFGARVLGDFLVGFYANKLSSSEPHDEKIKLTYPSSGSAYLLSHVSILVRQSSNAGKAYILAGGIAKRHIQIVVEANQTYIFEYEAHFYGY